MRYDYDMTHWFIVLVFLVIAVVCVADGEDFVHSGGEDF